MAAEKEITITSNSKITLTLVLTLIGGAAWLTTNQLLTASTAKAAEKLEQKVNELERKQAETNQQILVALQEIKTKVNIIYEEKRRR